MNYSMITDIFFVNSNTKTKEEFINLFKSGLFNNENHWDNYNLQNTIDGISNIINSQLKKRMSQMSLGVYYVLENGPGQKLVEEEPIFLFSGFSEIDTTDKIIKSIVLEGAELVSPTLFHNSVHNTPLGYYTIIKKIHNYCATISDGLLTNLSFINYIKNLPVLEENLVIVTGEEYSPFFELDKTQSIDIKPSFASYRIIAKSEKGFKFIGTVNSINEIKNIVNYQNIFSDKMTFFELKKKYSNVYTEYPIVKDNPCGIIFRLAMPFYFDISGKSLIIDKMNDKLYLFEVLI